MEQPFQYVHVFLEKYGRGLRIEMLWEYCDVRVGEDVDVWVVGKCDAVHV